MSPWDLDGNSGTNSANNFLGTIDNQSLTIRTSNQPRATVHSNSNVGIGTTNPQRLLHVQGSESTAAGRSPACHSGTGRRPRSPTTRASGGSGTRRAASPGCGRPKTRSESRPTATSS